MDANAITRDRARLSRRKMDLPEVLLWNQLRRRQLEGLHFRRQHPFGPFILDFYCDAAKLAVEVDGYSHDVGDRPERDLRRDRWLADRGVRTLRIPAREVLNDMDGALATIAAVVHGTVPPSLREGTTKWWRGPSRSLGATD
jgi:very-short-patch-repair endonuclease